MRKFKEQTDFTLDGFLYFFGIVDNPSDRICEEILSKSPAHKIKTDLRRINSDYRKKYVAMRKEIMHIG